MALSISMGEVGAVRFEIARQEDNIVEIVPERPEGDRDLGEASLQAKSLFSDGVSHVVVNMKNISHLDSAELGLLVMLRSQARARKGELKLINLKPEMKKLMRAMRLDLVFGIPQ